MCIPELSRWSARRAQSPPLVAVPALGLLAGAVSREKVEVGAVHEVRHGVLGSEFGETDCDRAGVWRGFEMCRDVVKPATNILDGGVRERAQELVATDTDHELIGTEVRPYPRDDVGE